jgi:hypothetical protein
MGGRIKFEIHGQIDKSGLSNVVKYIFFPFLEHDGQGIEVGFGNRGRGGREEVKTNENCYPYCSQNCIKMSSHHENVFGTHHFVYTM